MKRKRKIKVKSQYFIGSFLIFLGIVLIASKYISSYYMIHQETQKIENFLLEQATSVELIDEKLDIPEEDSVKHEEIKNDNDRSEDYLAIIEIPKIALRKGLYSKFSKNNNVNKNIEILEDSNYPDYEKGNFILIAHAGNSNISYFQNINQLELQNQINIYYNHEKYIYAVVDKYEVDKTGKVEIKKNPNATSLTLISCKHNTDKQIVVICNLIGKEKFYGI